MTLEERDYFLTCEDSELANGCQFEFVLGGGRGGQKVNKTSSRVRLFHAPSGLTSSCGSERSQALNRRHALSMLRLAIAFNIRCVPSPDFTFGSVPSVSGVRYPYWVAHIFDILASKLWDVKEAAQFCNVSRSSFEKALRRDSALYREFVIRRGSSKRADVTGQ